MGNGSRRRHMMQGSGTSSGGWRVAGAVDVQVDGALLWERRWLSGENQEVFNDERLWMVRR